MGSYHNRLAFNNGSDLVGGFPLRELDLGTIVRRSAMNCRVSQNHPHRFQDKLRAGAGRPSSLLVLPRCLFTCQGTSIQSSCLLICLLLQPNRFVSALPRHTTARAISPFRPRSSLFLPSIPMKEYTLPPWDLDFLRSG